jgi:hypothetical protein
MADSIKAALLRITRYTLEQLQPGDAEDLARQLKDLLDHFQPARFVKSISLCYFSGDWRIAGLDAQAQSFVGSVGFSYLLCLFSLDVD